MDGDSLINLQIDKAVSLIHAVSNGRRISLIRTLLAGERIVGDLALVLGLSQSATSQHLHVLKMSGILRQKKIGQIRLCSIDPEMASILNRILLIAEQHGPSLNPAT